MTAIKILLVAYLILTPLGAGFWCAYASRTEHDKESALAGVAISWVVAIFTLLILSGEKL